MIVVCFRWEYVWCVSVVLSFIGLSAARSNKVINMQKYMAGVIVFGLFPVLYCMIHYMNDVVAYMKLDEDTELEDAENILVWQVSFAAVRVVQETPTCFILEPPIRPPLVRIRICRLSSSCILACVCLEPLQRLEITRWKEVAIAQ